MRVLSFPELRSAKGIPYSSVWIRKLVADGKFPKPPPTGLPIKLASGMLKIDGVSRQSKCRALRDLERRGLTAGFADPTSSASSNGDVRRKIGAQRRIRVNAAELVFLHCFSRQSL